MKAEHFNHLVEVWDLRAKAQYLKPGTVKYNNARIEFFLGAHAMALALGDTSGVGFALIPVSLGQPLEKRPVAEEPAAP